MKDLRYHTEYFYHLSRYFIIISLQKCFSFNILKYISVEALSEIESIVYFWRIIGLQKDALIKTNTIFSSSIMFFSIALYENK